MSIDPAQPIPIYFQLKTLLLEEILGGRYGSDDRLPTEHELCEQYGISRTPVTRALSELAEEGVILRHRRRGTFVNPHWLPPAARSARGAGRGRRRGHGRRMIRDAAGDADPGQPRHGSPRVAAPDADARGRRRPRARPRDHRLRLDLRSSPPPASCSPLDDLDEAWIRSEHDVDFLEPLVRREPLRRPHLRRPRVRGRRRASGTARRELERVGLQPPATWAELRSRRARDSRRNGSPHPIVMPGGLEGRRDDGVLPDRIPRLERRATVLAPRRRQLDSRATAQALRFLRSLVEDGLHVRRTSSRTSGTDRSGCSPRGRRRSASAAATRRRRSPRRLACRSRSSGSTSASWRCPPGRRGAPPASPAR